MLKFNQQTKIIDRILIAKNPLEKHLPKNLLIKIFNLSEI